jgi:hypothetical protein
MNNGRTQEVKCSFSGTYKGVRGRIGNVRKLKKNPSNGVQQCLIIERRAIFEEFY